MSGEPLDVVGIPAGGWSELGETARMLIAAAEVLVGSRRQLDLVPSFIAAEQIAWPRPLKPALPDLVGGLADRQAVVLASGDPLVSGIGTTLIDLLGPDRVRVHPAVSSVALAGARMGWSSETVAVVSVVGRDLDLVIRQLAPGQRLLVLSAGAETPGELATLLREAGYGPSALTVLGDLGTGAETRRASTAAAGVTSAPALNVVAVECVADPAAAPWGWVPGLPDDGYDTDGQLTKRDLRASALARLAPRPGEVLWDLGAGSGSIGIEWARTHPRCRTFAVERHPARAARVAENAARLGVPGLQVITATAVDALAELPAPDAIFVGGGLTAELLGRCWDRLRAGGRLVAHAVTVETEQLLVEGWRERGGELVRIGVERMEPLGSYHAWKPSRAVVQWSLTR